MPAITDVIQALTTPPLISLQQVLDTNGPFAAGDHTIDTFHTDGAFLLPAGSYGVSGTYGVIVRATTIPINASRLIGFNGIVAGQDESEDTFLDRLCQVVIYRSFPITGALYAIQRLDCQYATQLTLWSAFNGAAPDHIGLHVFPGWAVDLYWMCVL